MTTARGDHPAVPARTWTTWSTRRSRRCWRMPEVQEVFDAIKLGRTAPTPPVLIVQAVHDSVIAVDDIDELAHTLRRRRRERHLPPRHVQRTHAAAPDVGADDAALAAPTGSPAVRWTNTSSGPLADPAQPDHLRRHVAPRRHRRPGSCSGGRVPLPAAVGRLSRPAAARAAGSSRPARPPDRHAGWPPPATRRPAAATAAGNSSVVGDLQRPVRRRTPAAPR